MRRPTSHRRALIAFAAGGCLAVLAPVRPATAALLFRDDYTLTAANPDTTDVNFQDSTRQSGGLAPLTYTKGAEPVFSQVGNPGAPNALLLAGRSAGLPGEVSLDHNFIEVPGVGNATVIQFDVNPVQVASGFNTTATSWLAIDFGATAAGRNVFPQNTDGIGILFRGTRETQAFDSGTNLGAARFAPVADTAYHHIRIEITNAGGNPFAGNGSPDLIEAFSDGSPTPFFSHVRPQGFSGNYISLIGEGEGSGGDNVVRHELTNFQVSIEPVPEPNSLGVLGMLATAGLCRRRTFGCRLTSDAASRQ